MENIKTIIDNKKFIQKPHALKHEWQAFAYKIWYDLDGNKRNLPQVIKFIKTYKRFRRYLDNAYNFTIDYTGNIPKLRLFFWKFHEQLKEYNSRVYRYLINYYNGVEMP